MTVLFWFSLAVLLYAFVGYPVLVRIGAAVWGKKILRDQSSVPRISVLLSVYNEESVIGQKIENFLALDYPEDRIDLLVISDGCTDQTEEIVRSCATTRVRLFIQEERGGKTLALNRGALEATGEILVFTDANSMFRPESIRKLVAPFADATVGLVSGRSIYVDSVGNETLGGVYRRYEEWIKEGESRLFSIVGADGAIYALRRDVFEPLKPEFINDLLHPIQVVSKGLKAVSEPWAVVVEAAEDDGEAELKRQTRIMAQSWHVCLRHLGGIIREGQYGYAWQVVSHKILRWIALPMLGGLGLSAFFGLFDFFPTLSFTGLFCLIVFAWMGAKGKGGIARVAWVFVVLHWAALVGLYKFIVGENFVIWEPRTS
jgi:cellulose synthase/poly-beta-1,6-N-acetylglucosamine synthase-like glycosyltransferase